MKSLYRSFWTSLILAFVATGAQAALPATIGDRPVTSLAPLVEAASPAVVNISVTQVRRSPFGRSSEVGGAGSGVSEFLASAASKTPVLHLGLPDDYVEHGDHSEQLARCGLDSIGIQERVKRRLHGLRASYESGAVTKTSLAT